MLEIAARTFKDTDVHVHFPAGAIPKDGPSAGAAITLAIASVFSRRPIRRDVALTGEVTLRGKVLEIGGVKEKVLAAYRAGLRQVIMPSQNEKDLRDIPDEVKHAMAFTFVSTMDEVLHLMLMRSAADAPADSAQPSSPGKRQRPAAPGDRRDDASDGTAPGGAA